MTADEVVIFREDDRLVVVPVERRPSLAEILSQLEPFDEGLPNVPDPPTQPEDIF